MTPRSPEHGVKTDVGRPARTPLILAGLGILAIVVVFAALLFVSAGRIRWMAGWLYLALVFVSTVVSWACLKRWNPQLIVRRMRFGKGTKTWDKVWSALFSPVVLALYISAGLDARDGVSSLPGTLWPVGLAIFLPGCALFIWSMTINPFFEKTVRIQTECGHRVIDTGPYSCLRHPGYLGFIAWVVSTPLLLESAWAFAPACLAVVGIVIRTALEDRTLRAELEGYQEYAARVRFRLIPGIW